MPRFAGFGLLFFASLVCGAAAAQEMQHMDHSMPEMHDHAQHGRTAQREHRSHAGHQQTAGEPAAKSKGKKEPDHSEMHHDGGVSMPASEQSGHTGGGHAGHEMMGVLGPYVMAREGSGTSWLPDTTPHQGVHSMAGEWSTMWHALFNLAYDQQGGPRGGDKTFVGGMFMGMAQRPLGDGTFGLRAMLSPDPFMGASGYPLLLATGETAEGRTPLIDRQHPHDLFMELAATYSHPLDAKSSVFLYAGLPGEPALGPPAFMHRTSGMDIPEAPITHHWLDSTHISFGVLTAGLVLDTWKVEASAFRGREPDQYRYDIEAPKLDSFSGRVSWNPLRELSLQASWGRLHSPEQLEPEVNEDRFTTSAIYMQPFGDSDLWSTTVAWGRKMNSPGNTLDGFILETAVILQKTYTLFLRGEHVQEDELTATHAVYTVDKLSVGGIWDFFNRDHTKIGIGALVSLYGLPDDLRPLYGTPTSSIIFGRIKIE
jgi:hypothetical protein